jgi:thermostable 8-oxoguanine DNA glycosylase
MGTEKTWQDFKTLEEFAQYVQGRAQEFAALACASNNKTLFHKAADLCTLAANIHNQGAMAQDRTAGEYDLSALSVDLRQVGWRTPPSHPETDEDEDGEDNPYRGE